MALLILLICNSAYGWLPTTTNSRLAYESSDLRSLITVENDGKKAVIGAIEHGTPSALSAFNNWVPASSLRSVGIVSIRIPDITGRPLPPGSERFVTSQCTILNDCSMSAANFPISKVSGNQVKSARSFGNASLEAMEACCLGVSLRGADCALNSVNSLSAATARCKASAKCDSASADCCLADLMSVSNESASCRAPRAINKALEAAVRAFRASFAAFFIAPSAAPVLLSASLACDRAVPESVIAWDASLEACLALASREPISCSERESFLCPYGYASSSANTAIAKKQRPIFSNSLSLLLSSEKWASTSNNTSNAKNTSAAPSRSLWARLTDSSEFQSGMNIAKCIIVAFILLGAFTSRLLRYRKKWKGNGMRDNPSTQDKIRL